MFGSLNLSLLIAIVAVGILMLIFMTLSKYKKPTLDKEDYQVRWLKIENGLQKENPVSYNMSIISADRLLGHALNELGVPGKTMGDQMKKIDDGFSAKNSVWSAHKLRNQIAHEPDFEVNYTQAKRALGAFKQALQDLEAI